MKMFFKELCCRVLGHKMNVDYLGYYYCGRCFETLPAAQTRLF